MLIYQIQAIKVINFFFSLNDKVELKQNLPYFWNCLAMYSVIHGGIDQDLRKKSVEFLTSLPFDGHAIGGSVGKNRQEMFELLKFLVPLLPSTKPNHLLGIGDQESILNCIPYGIDSFDSAYPTIAARHGRILTSEGQIDLRASEHKLVFNQPLDSNCNCYT